jgi:hypothetical protein
MNVEARFGTSSDIICTGVKSIVVRDDSSARNIASGSHLKLWRNNEELNLWIDCFDVRNELDVIELKQLNDVLSKAQIAPGPFEYMLDDNEASYFEDLVMERFQDLLDFKEEDLSREQPLSINQLDSLEASRDVTDDNNSVGLPWGYQSDRTEFWVRPVREPYVVPIIWDVPSEIKLPMTKKQFDVIVHTVKNIRNRGSQFEILLKLKESDTNPLFDFLNIDCDLHELFEYIKRISADTFQTGLLLPTAASSSVLIDEVSTSDNLQVVEDEAQIEDEAIGDTRAVTEVPNALFLLGDTYGEDSSSDTEGEGEGEGTEEREGGEADDLVISSDNCDPDDSNVNPSEVLVEPIEIDDKSDSDSVSTASTASFPSESPRLECNNDFENEALNGSILPTAIAATDDLLGADQVEAEDSTVSSHPSTAENKIADSFEEGVIGAASESTLTVDTLQEAMEEGEVNESEDESESCEGSLKILIEESPLTLESEDNEKDSEKVEIKESESLEMPTCDGGGNEESVNNSDMSKSPRSADADAESIQNVDLDDKEDDNLGDFAQATSCLELTNQLNFLDTETARLSSVDDDLLDDDVDQNDFWGKPFAIKTQSIEQLREIAEKRSKISQLIVDLQTALEVRNKKADRLKRVKLLRQQFEEKAALDKIEALKLKEDNLRYNVLDAIMLRDNDAETSSSDESSSSGEQAREKVRSKQRERRRSSSTDSSHDSQARHRRKGHGRDKDRRRSRSRSRECDRKKKKGKEKERDRERRRDHGSSRPNKSETQEMNGRRRKIKSDRRGRSDNTTRNDRKRPSSRSRSRSRSPVRSRRSEDPASLPAPEAAPTASALDFKDKIRVALGVEPLKQPQAAPVPFRDRIQMALDALK